MSKKASMLLCLALLLMFSLTACVFGTQPSPVPAVPEQHKAEPAPAEPEQTPEQMPEQPAEIPAEAETITAAAFTPQLIAGTYAEQMFLYHSAEVALGDGLATAELYVDAADGGDGWLEQDDGHRWSLLLRSGDQAFLLLDKEYVQMGAVEYCLYEDYETNGALIIAQIRQGAGLTVYEFRCTQTEAVKTKIYQTGGNLGLLDASPGAFPRIPD